MTSSKKEAPAAETTRLLSNPSPHSADGPVLPKYSPDTVGLPLTASSSGLPFEDVQGNLEINLQQALNDSSRPVKNSSGNRKMDPRRANLLMFGTCLFSVVLVVLIFFSPFQSVTTPPSYSDPTSYSDPLPFSKKHPVRDMGLIGYKRPLVSSPPEGLFHHSTNSTSSNGHPVPLPTNAFYQNFLLLQGEPSNLHRAYALPYILDAVGPIQGLHVLPNFLVASTAVVQLSVNEAFGLTLGAAGDVNGSNEKTSHKFKVGKATELGVTLHWDALKMSSSIVRGMAYATMIYEERIGKTSHGSVALPTIASRLPFGRPPLADGKTAMECGAKQKKVLVEKEVELYFDASRYSWVVFFSEPVWLQCGMQEDTGASVLQVMDFLNDGDESDDKPFIMRATLLDDCTNCKEDIPESSKKAYGQVLRRHADYYPGPNTSMKYKVEDDAKEGKLTLDWDVQCMSTSCKQNLHRSLRLDGDSATPGLITFALPHHLDKLDDSVLPNNELYCKTSISGQTCLVEGSSLTIVEPLPSVSLRAPRSLKAKFIPLMADALKYDMNFSLPGYFDRGAGDTYFSGKMLSKLGRILIVAEEVVELCHHSWLTEYHAPCKNSTLPSQSEMSEAIDRLQSGVEIWINGTAETPFVYDTAWGGLVSCGCQWNGDGCDNKAPDCPAFIDQGLNFGNAFYNDQHFHYGYHIYAASIVAHFRPNWGKEHFEEVLLLVRSIANPSELDDAFPLFRHKDWYQGSSWASGIPLPPFLNGKNQESSSEAIAAYESVALFGQIMSEIWHSAGETAKAATSLEIKKVGQLMTATELRSAKTYFHVRQNDESKRIYPKEYTANVVGILWQTMAQFGTWFGPAPYLPFGIQMLPLTPISEERDDIAWMNEMYYPFSDSCAADFQCTDAGWVILQLAALATVGYPDEAAKRAGMLPDDAFTNAGGNGHSRSNTLWYVGTRPDVEVPVALAESDVRGTEEKRPAPVFVLKDCYTPATCTDQVLDQKAGSHTCRERIRWTIDTKGKSQWGACSDVSGEYPDICGPCDPTQGTIGTDSHDDSDSKVLPSLPSGAIAECPACTAEECNSDLNRCPLFKRTFVCTQGSNVGGCSAQPWDDAFQCETCCEMTACLELTVRDNEAKKVTKDANPLKKPVCPPCQKSICYGEVNQCPLHTAPYICLHGHSAGGCSSRPWEISDMSECSECCELTQNC